MFWDEETARETNEDYEYRSSEMATGSNRLNISFDEYDDKENMRPVQSPSKQDAELSLYETNQTAFTSSHESLANCSSLSTAHQQLEKYDLNSQDSGYNASDLSNAKSFGSLGSMEEDFLNIEELEREDENCQLSNEMSSLISGTIVSSAKKSPEFTFNRPSYRRSVSMVVDGATPNSSRARTCLFVSPTNKTRAFKRPDEFSGHSPIISKRSKLFAETEVSSPAPTLMRSLSATPATSEDCIKSALQRSMTEPDLIGDFSKTYCLPLVAGRHQDLKSITAHTLASLIRGQYKDNVADFKVIDCRYPYEYEGGHITGALNIYMRKQLMEDLLIAKANENNPNESGLKRQILVFHCEFSSERGPNLSRFLRNMDRIYNKDLYPYLHYPEIYLLDGGYKVFYEQYPSLCIPEGGYLPMLHPSHEGDLRHFHAKSKTWNADSKMRSNMRVFQCKRL